jgi:hypothetical protein
MSRIPTNISNIFISFLSILFYYFAKYFIIFIPYLHFEDETIGETKNN